MPFAIKAEMNGNVLAGQLFKTASKHPDIISVTPDLDEGGNLRSGSFSITPENNLGINGLSGSTYAAPDDPFELGIDVKAISWPVETEEAKNEALFSIFQPLVDLYNQENKSQARIVLKQ